MDPAMVDFEHLFGTLFPRNYLPFAAAIYIFLLQKCAPYAVVVFGAVVVLGTAAAATALWLNVRRLSPYRWYVGLSIFATALFGWGTEMTLMRGNIEGILVLFVFLGAYFFAKRRYGASAAAFAVAACIKPYPLLWFLLLGRHRKFRAIGMGVSAGVGITLGSLLVFDHNPLHAWHVIHGGSNFFSNYILCFRALQETMTDHSILETMKTLVRVVLNHGTSFGYKENLMSAPNNPVARLLYYADLYVSAALVLCVVKKVWNMPVLNQVFTLACVTTLLPPVTGDYTLTILLVPMAYGLVFLLQDVAEASVPVSLRNLLWFVLPCAWIMAINPLWPLHGVLKCFALLALLGASISVPLPSSLFEEVARVELPAMAEV
jgi:hypothetical protein